MSTDINIGHILETLNNKVDIDFKNTDMSAIKSYYVSGGSGFVIFNNGYCEQWGSVDGTTGTVNLLKQYANTNYNIQITSRRGDANYTTCAWRISISVNSFTWGATPTYTAGIYWRTCGFLLEGEY